MTGLNPPFPWFGGKRRYAKLVWERFGDPVCYAEPFAGGLAVLLGRPPTRHNRIREIVVDLDGFICNFWRSVRDDPDQVAHYANWPVIHQDLTARHKWLVDWHAGNSAKLFEDPDYCDPKVAGWWVWGQCNWIGSGWGSEPGSPRMPHFSTNIGEKGVLKHRIGQMPYLGNTTGGQGVLKHRVVDKGKMPRLSKDVPSGSILRDRLKGGIQGAIQLLSDRLRDVSVLGGSWRQATGNSVLLNIDGSRRSAAVFLDPPYLTERRTGVYKEDVEEQANQVAQESYEWAIEHQNDYRIAYCCQTDDFPVPEGWTYVVKALPSLRIKNRKGKNDCIMFSPNCRGQNDLFGNDLFGVAS